MASVMDLITALTLRRPMCMVIWRRLGRLKTRPQLGGIRANGLVPLLFPTEILRFQYQEIPIVRCGSIQFLSVFERIVLLQSRMILRTLFPVTTSLATAMRVIFRCIRIRLYSTLTRIRQMLILILMKLSYLLTFTRRLSLFWHFFGLCRQQMMPMTLSMLFRV